MKRNAFIALVIFFIMEVFYLPFILVKESTNPFFSLYISFLANLLFLVAGLLLSWIAWFFLGHRQVISFFKPLSGDRVVVAVSLPELARDKGRDIPMVSFEEMKRAYELAEIFTYRIRQFEEFSQGILERAFISPFSYEVIHSPEEGVPIPDSNFNISLGSPMYNGYSKWMEENLPTKIKTKVCNGEISFSYSGSPDYNDLNHAFIQRIVENDKVFFYLGGNSDSATTGAVLHFKKHWKSWLHLSDRNFAVILWVEPKNPNITSEIVPPMGNGRDNA